MNRKFYRRMKLFAGSFVIISLFGLIFMPMFPWISTTNNEGVTEYANEAMIHSWTNSINMAISAMSTYSSSMTGSNYNEQIRTIKDSLSVFTGLGRSIRLISWSFWLTLISGIIIFIGLAFYKLEKRLESLSYVFLIGGCVSVIFSILILVGHIQFMLRISSLSSDEPLSFAARLYAPSFDFSSAYFGYNYVPLILGIIVLILSVIYTKMIVSASFSFFKTWQKRQ
jgi:hypothetical protein